MFVIRPFEAVSEQCHEMLALPWVGPDGRRVSSRIVLEGRTFGLKTYTSETRVRLCMACIVLRLCVS